MFKYQKRRFYLRANPIVLCIVFFFCLSAMAQEEQGINSTETKELETIKSLIAQTQAQLDKKLEDSERLQQELKLAELQIAQTATMLNKTDNKLEATRKDLNTLQKEKRSFEKQIDEQKSALAKQVKSAYMTGDYDFAKMIFSQDEAGKFERVLTYYKYLNKARQSQIENFVGLVAALEKVKVELDAQEQQLVKLVQQQSVQSKKLGDQQRARFDKFRALEQQIQSDQEKVAQLQQQENSLIAAIEEAELAAQRARERAEKADVELLGLTNRERSLLKPVAGKMQSLFGKRRQGQVRWKGVVINAKAGAPVVAVADGVVLYADWLKGFGLVTIVDHGKGYMTVYGRNQALLRKVGDNVAAGETISLVGNSGGQARASLYFEIRHKGKALNPGEWLARS